MWFGGEEQGLVGSQYYAAHLSQADVDKIDVMIDTDMIASPN
jgi:Zn-dependent M28 family amino/carboxypeptidase